MFCCALRWYDYCSFVHLCLIYPHCTVLFHWNYFQLSIRIWYSETLQFSYRVSHKSFENAFILFRTVEGVFNLFECLAICFYFDFNSFILICLYFWRFNFHDHSRHTAASGTQPRKMWQQWERLMIRKCVVCAVCHMTAWCYSVSPDFFLWGGI